MLGLLCLRRGRGCWRGTSLQKSCALGTFLCGYCRVQGGRPRADGKWTSSQMLTESGRALLELGDTVVALLPGAHRGDVPAGAVCRGPGGPLSRRGKGAGLTWHCPTADRQEPAAPSPTPDCCLFRTTHLENRETAPSLHGAGRGAARTADGRQQAGAGGWGGQGPAVASKLQKPRRQALGSGHHPY